MLDVEIVINEWGPRWENDSHMADLRATSIDRSTLGK